MAEQTGPEREKQSLVDPNHQYPRPAAAAPTPKPAGPEVSTLETQVTAIFEAVSQVRQLQPLEEIAPQFVSMGELMKVVRDDLERRRQEIEEQGAVMSVFGLIPRTIDVYEPLLDAELEFVGIGVTPSFYDGETGDLYVLRDIRELAIWQKLGLAQTYLGALQDQHFKVHALSETLSGNADASEALDILRTGDLSLSIQQYILLSFSPDMFSEFDQMPEPDPSVMNSMAEIDLGADLSYQRIGATFVTAISQSGPGALALVYSSPPASTEQVMHSEKYLGREAPIEVTLPDLANALGSGWAETTSSVLGEFSLSQYLEDLTDDRGAAAAAAGCGGDRYSLLEGPDGQRALALLTVWDSQADALEFHSLVACDQCTRTYAGLVEDRVLLVFGASAGVVATVKEEFPGFPPVPPAQPPDPGTLVGTVSQQVWEVRELEPVNELAPRLVTTKEITTLWLNDLEKYLAKTKTKTKTKTKKEQALYAILGLIPNPPKDTDGRREDSGRGWVRELQGRWPGVGVDGRPAAGLQSPHRAPKALCGSCDARDGARLRGR